ncbi:hypothetical protein GCM10010286_24810 [Streptomyces toxytricini]|nr:hypothetical protein GCM10010286_24810 [Streptomyces toxytricini]
MPRRAGGRCPGGGGRYGGRRRDTEACPGAGHSSQEGAGGAGRYGAGPRGDGPFGADARHSRRAGTEAGDGRARGPGRPSRSACTGGRYSAGPRGTGACDGTARGGAGACGVGRHGDAGERYRGACGGR